MKVRVKNKNNNKNKELDVLWGGKAKPTSYNSFSNTPLIEFTGKSHKKGGIGISYNGNTAEVQGGESGIIDNSGELNIMGDMKIPGTNKTFQSMSKKIAKKEKNSTNILDNADDLLSSTIGDDTEYGKLKKISGNLMGLGATMQQ